MITIEDIIEFEQLFWDAEGCNSGFISFICKKHSELKAEFKEKKFDNTVINKVIYPMSS